MPKSILQVKQFEGGLINYYDPRDIPETGLAEAVGVMCDITGKIRTMGTVSTHVEINDGESFQSGTFKPGYGLFAFNADYDLKQPPSQSETRMLAIQSGQYFTIYDSNTNILNKNQIQLTLETDNLSDIAPIFYYVDGCLRVSDSNISSTGVTTDATRSYKYISKTWFPGITNEYIIPSKWYDLTSYIFPPSCDQDNILGQLVAKASYAARDTAHGDDPGFGKLSVGTLQLEVANGGAGDGEFQGDTALTFGCSFVYDDGQESPVTNFLANDGTNLTVDTSAYGDNHAMKFKISVGLGSSFDIEAEVDPEVLPFDPRLAGVNVYLTGDVLGMYDDPVFMAHCYFGTSDDDIAYFESHDGVKQEGWSLADASGAQNLAVTSSAYLFVKKMPSITYELKTGVSHNESTTAARYASACVVKS